jgi:hypothetical protein
MGGVGCIKFNEVRNVSPEKGDDRTHRDKVIPATAEPIAAMRVASTASRKWFVG